MPLFRLPEKGILFPDPALAEEDGLLAIGGDLCPERLVLAYSHGIFPWYSEGEPIMWWCPHERYIIRPERIHISHSLSKYMRKHDIRLVINRDFPDTMHRCRMKRENAEGTWITDDMEKAYAELNRRGYAMAAEAQVDGRIAGGLYGVLIGKNFFGESMYSDEENGSKLTLVLLARELKEKGFHMIDCQFHTDFLESMGGEHISYEEYMELIEKDTEKI
ncbi:MAG: leucyl/phenylalanyl-tRNA--protein transferase [Lachnospiraceae bacterium]|nr:leucyl/phenylalanyl-tRNA--protein transferase [Lachnospiraceae bacterium]